LLKKIKAKAILSVHPWAFLESFLHKTCNSLA
jgi:hypothetical protein